jgi:hypothetical protein
MIVVSLGHRGVSSGGKSPPCADIGGIDPMGGVVKLNPKLQSYGLELPCINFNQQHVKPNEIAKYFPRNLRVMLKF